jgi:hypothetical protein
MTRLTSALKIPRPARDADFQLTQITLKTDFVVGVTLCFLDTSLGDRCFAARC